MSEDPLRVTHAGRPSGYVWDLSERGQDSEYTKDEASQILDFPHEHRHPDVQHARTEKPQVRDGWKPDGLSASHNCALFCLFFH